MLHLCGIYKIEHNDSGLFYIGSTTKSFKQRWKTHKTELNQNIHGNKHLQNAWNKYGNKRFSFEILEIVEEPDKVLEHEQKWLDKHWGRQNLYNILPTAGSPKGRVVSEETKQKLRENAGRKSGFVVQENTKELLSELNSGSNHPNFGKPRSEETKQRIAEPQKGRVFTEEHRRKLSEAARNRKACN